MSLIPFLVAGIFLFIAYSSKSAADAKAKNWVTVRGKVLEIKSYWTNRKHYFPVVAFHTVQGGQQLLHGKGSRNMLYQAGQIVDVVYDPRNPAHAEVRYDLSDTEMRRWRYMIAAFFLFGAFVFLVFDLIIVIGGLLAVINA